jgi:hypothetical protein
MIKQPDAVLSADIGEPDRVAIYARVSSDRQARDGTIASQVEALRQRVSADALSLSESMCFIDDGYSGSTLIRPQLERLRDLAAAGRSADCMCCLPTGWRATLWIRWFWWTNCGAAAWRFCS